MTVREHWGLGSNPIPAPGLAELLEERGIKVLALSLPGTLSGLTCWVRRKHGGRVPAIVVNTDEHGERQRFTLAHELGHMVLEVDRTVDVEKASHRFAGAFLMPAETLRAEVGKHRSTISIGELVLLKRYFGASMQAITYRSKDLGVISTATYSRLFEEFGRRGWRSPPYREPEPLPGEAPKRFKRLCYRALAEDAVSEAKTAELLGISVGQLKEEMDAQGNPGA
jgi:Zn-dependent peptidase ImmA (M78 family)